MLTLFVTVFYPAVHSIRAIQSENSKEDDKYWLTYWMIYGVFTFVETFAGFLLNMIPYFAWLKLGFFGWLMLPQFRGAQVVYDQVLKPQLEKHSETINDLIKATQMSAESATDAVKNVAKENLTLDNLNAANKKLM
jgi:receptor expression-enhancing protein 5/6